MNPNQEYVGDMIDAPKKFSFGGNRKSSFGGNSFGGNSFQAANKPFGLNGVRKNPINNAGFAGNAGNGRTRFL